MENLSHETKQELKKYRHNLYTLDGAFTGQSFYSRDSAEKMQNLIWKKENIALQIITEK